MSDNDPQALYRFYDATGALLYVGITADPGARWRKHAHEKVWWHEVAQITLEVHPDRAAVLTAEREAIRSERPSHNVAHNHLELRVQRSDPWTRWWINDFGRTADTMPDDCHDICVKANHLAIYLPYRWVDGCGYYQCAAGHQWTCWWGHSRSGTAPEWRGVPFEEFAA